MTNKMYKLFFIIFSFIFLMSSSTYANEIAITFDDLPAQEDKSAAEQMQINQMILSALKQFSAPAIGFVNEGKVHKNKEISEKTKILKLWIDNGHTLGNHTYSHKAFSRTKDDEFFEDIEKGSIISAKLMKEAGIEYKYFRHPYLDTGTSEAKRKNLENYLKHKGYIIAPVTIDTDDWKFDQELRERPNDKLKIITKYLEHTKLKFAFYKQASEKIFNRNIKHVWLLHCNQINAYAMKDLLQIASDFGYKFISLDDAMKDLAYQEADNYYAPFGVSWLYRWDFTRGKVVDWSKEPEVDNNPFIRTKSLNLVDKSRNRSIPVALYVSGESKGKAKAGIIKLPVAIINHGYQIKNTEYSFIAQALAAHGYFVVSIQHDLVTDVRPKTGTLWERRKPFWERGVQNILFVINELQKIEPQLDFSKVILIGHSDGGDASMMLAQTHPEIVLKIISLDSRRYPFPRNKGLDILRFGAIDDEPDEGVVPESGVQVIYVKGARHIDLSDRGSEVIKDEIQKSIIKFLDR